MYCQSECGGLVLLALGVGILVGGVLPWMVVKGLLAAGLIAAGVWVICMR
jgi:hypothetical protein